MYIKRILRVLILGVTVSVSDSRIFVSRVPVSGDLGDKERRAWSKAWWGRQCVLDLQFM